MRAVRVLVLAAMVAGALLFSVSARAAASSRLVYGRGPGTESCPDEAALRKAVVARVGYDPFFPWAELTVVATLKRDGEKLLGHVELVASDGIVRGARDMTDAHGDCAELVTSMALAISIALDLLDHREPVAPKPAAAVPAVVEPPVPPPKVAARVEETPYVRGANPAGPPDTPAASVALVPRGRVFVDAGVAAIASAGIAPTIAVGGGLFVRVRWPAFSVAVEGRADLPASRRAGGAGAVSAALRSGSLVPCVRWGRVAGCAVVAVGSLETSGDGGLRAPDDSALYVGAGARLAIEQPVSSALSFFVHGEALATLAGAEVRVDGASLWRSPAASVSLGAGAALHF